MNLYDTLYYYLEYYYKILADAKKLPVKNINGRIEVQYHPKDKYTYYLVTSENGMRKRNKIKPEDFSIILNLANEDYSSELIKLSEKRIKQFNRILKDYREEEIDEIYIKKSDGIKDILPPIVPTYKMQLQDFKDKMRFYLNFNNESKKFKTKKGDYVRSKSEKIIADLLYDYGLEYVYEAGITLDYKEYFPDFTVFHPIKRQEIYWEHFGMLNDYDYSVNTYKKIMNYELNGYLTNDRLIVTMEYQNDLNVDWVKLLIENVLLKWKIYYLTNCSITKIITASNNTITAINFEILISCLSFLTFRFTT